MINEFKIERNAAAARSESTAARSLISDERISTDRFEFFQQRPERPNFFDRTKAPVPRQHPAA
jgi:hypothetical protein